MESTGITVDDAAWRATSAGVLRVLLVGTTGVAAFAVGLATSAGGAFFAGAVLPSDVGGFGAFSITDPRRLAVPLIVLGVLVAALVAARTPGRRSMGGWPVAAVGSLLLCLPVLVVQLSDGNIIAITFGQQPATTSIVATLIMAVGAGLAVGGVLTAAPVDPRRRPAPPVPWVRLLVPAALAVGVVTRSAVNIGWQPRISAFAAASTVLATVLAYRYGRQAATVPVAEPRSAGGRRAVGEGFADAGPARVGAAGGWWAPAAVLLVAQIGALVAHVAVISHYGPAMGSEAWDTAGNRDSPIFDLAGARTGLVAETLVMLAFVGVVASYAAHRWGAAALRVLCVVLGAGYALGTHMVAAPDLVRKPTIVVAIGAAVVTVLCVTLARRASPSSRDMPEAGVAVAPARRVPWDLVGLGAACLATGLTQWKGSAGVGSLSPRIELGIAAVVVSLVACVPVVYGIRGAGQRLLIAFAVAVFIAGAQVGFAFGRSVFYREPDVALSVAYRQQIWILAMVPLVLVAVTALLAWVAGTRRTRRMSDSMA